jgi:hypothetical protein
MRCVLVVFSVTVEVVEVGDVQDTLWDVTRVL